MNKVYYIYRDTVDLIPFLSVEEFNDERYQLLDKLYDRDEAVKLMANLYRTTLVESDEYVSIIVKLYTLLEAPIKIKKERQKIIK